MRYASVTERLAGLGGAKWELHLRARALKAEGRDIIALTIGEPDVPTPTELADVAAAAMRAGRTGYSNGRGEPGLLKALADRYTARLGRTIGRDQILCFPGTQTTLYAVLMGLVETGNEVLLGDPLYATYEGLIASSGARAVFQRARRAGAAKSLGRPLHGPSGAHNWPRSDFMFSRHPNHALRRVDGVG